ncbi:hypothetical protein GCM10010519_18680 [Streptomyces lactacystinicus]|uniref:hypothetical protein n=1 Tax=unclassified Kitasatospora TaxID=2633591 RepID=UPI00336F31D4
MDTIFFTFFAAATAAPALVLLLWALKQCREKTAPAPAEEADATLGRWSAAATDPAAFMAERIRRAAGSDV